MAETDLPPTADKNLLGIAGFLTSLAAFCTGGLLSPIALVLSLLGLRRQPRGYAIAGTILSIVGVLVGLLGLTLWQGYEEAESRAAARAQLRDSQAAAIAVIENYRAETGELPDRQTGNELLEEAQTLDPWGVRYRYEDLDDTYCVRSAGADSVHQTDDDEVGHPDD